MAEQFEYWGVTCPNCGAFVAYYKEPAGGLTGASIRAHPMPTHIAGKIIECHDCRHIQTIDLGSIIRRTCNPDHPISAIK